jgi:UDP-N-acetylmuramoyl-L-alanyl-D-glutamate--2,6-diaminopimelate ligase
LGKSHRKPGQPKISVINADDPNADFFAAFSADRVVRYGNYMRRAGTDKPMPDFEVRYINYGSTFTLFDVIFDKRVIDDSGVFGIKLAGDFNVMNGLAAIATTGALGVAVHKIHRGLERVTAIPGRIERIDGGQDFTAIVDFAHTPNALKNALQAGRGMLQSGKKLIAVFGSAGLRDREKRRLMAEVAAELADFTILTAEDPRTESLDDILQIMADAMIAKGGVEGETFIRIPDRGEALYRACQMAKPGDIVMACGKGHEQSMCFGTTEYPWDDREGLRAAIKGEAMKGLPTATNS